MDRDEGVLPAVAGLIQRGSPVDSHPSIISDADPPGRHPVRRNIPQISQPVSEPVRNSHQTAIRHEKPIPAPADDSKRSPPVYGREASSSDSSGAGPGSIHVKHQQSPPAVLGHIGSDGEAAISHTVHIPAVAGLG